MRGLRPSEVLFLHAAVATRLDQPRGVADVAALAAALEEGAGAADAGLFERAAALAGALARQRPFHAANLAAAAAAAAVLLRHYDLHLQLPPAAMPALRALLLADDPAALADWLRAHTVPLP